VGDPAMKVHPITGYPSPTLTLF
jgi:hypothetical protein